MTEEHWFDTLNKLLTHDAPRRSVLRAAVALTFGQRLGATDAAGKSGGKGDKNNKKKDKKPKPPEDPKEQDVCDTTWPGKSKRKRRQRKHCRFIRRQCDGDDPRDFCIEEDDDGDKVARCCPELSPQCCGKKCCDIGARCCGNSCCGGPDTPEVKCCAGRCINTAISSEHCGTCGNRCDAGKICVRGQCEKSCGTGSCPEGLSCCASAVNGCCQAFETCCPGAGCKALGSDRENCDACGLACPLGQSCINGVCGCREGFKYCGDECDVCGRCIPEEWECCGRTSGCGPGHHCCGSGILKFCTAHSCA